MSDQTEQNQKIELKSFLGLSLTSEVEPLIYSVNRKAKLDMADKLKAFHERYEAEQIELEMSFGINDIECIDLNFWDDFYDDGFVPEGKVTETYAYIEDDRIPDIECFKLLSNLLSHIQTNNLLPSSVKLRMRFSDSTAKYPGLIDEHEYMLGKRWEIQIFNITHTQLDALVDSLKGYSDGCNFNIYSES